MSARARGSGAGPAAPDRGDGRSASSRALQRRQYGLDPALRLFDPWRDVNSPRGSKECVNFSRPTSSARAPCGAPPDLAWLSLGAAIVAGRRAPTEIYALAGDASVATGAAFGEWRSEHEAMMAAIEAGLSVKRASGRNPCARVSSHSGATYMARCWSVSPRSSGRLLPATIGRRCGRRGASRNSWKTR